MCSHDWVLVSERGRPRPQQRSDFDALPFTCRRFALAKLLRVTDPHSNRNLNTRRQATRAPLKLAVRERNGKVDSRRSPSGAARRRIAGQMVSAVDA